MPVCAKRDLLDMWILPTGVASPGWIGRCTLGLIFTLGFIFSELPQKPTNMPHLRTRWARYVFHCYYYPTTVFIPSLGPTDVMLQDDALTNFQPLMMNKYKLESWFYKNRWGGRGEGGSGWGTHVNPWLIHVNVWQKPLQYCKVISLQRIKINEKKQIGLRYSNSCARGTCAIIPTQCCKYIPDMSTNVTLLNT